MGFSFKVGSQVKGKSFGREDGEGAFLGLCPDGVGVYVMTEAGAVVTLRLRGLHVLDGFGAVVEDSVSDEAVQQAMEVVGRVRSDREAGKFDS